MLAAEKSDAAGLVLDETEADYADLMFCDFVTAYSVHGVLRVSLSCP